MAAQHIDGILRNWTYDPASVNVRLVNGKDGRDVIQMRLDMGLLQLETTGRPDGLRPEGAETYYDLLLDRALRSGCTYEFDEEECNEADREFVQFYHRRVCWLALRQYREAVRDADHTLGFMDLCKAHSPDEQWTLTHEQYRPFVVFHRTQAEAMAELEDDGDGPEAAIEHINAGLDRMRRIFTDYDAEDQFEEDELVQQLVHLRESVRDRTGIGRTLAEQLQDAISNEKYELAARLRDELAKREASR